VSESHPSRRTATPSGIRVRLRVHEDGRIVDGHRGGWLNLLEPERAHVHTRDHSTENRLTVVVADGQAMALKTLTSSITMGEGDSLMSAHREITRKPTTPGEILHEEFLRPLGMSQKDLANHLGCDVKV
jgi:hypothetical protein